MPKNPPDRSKPGARWRLKADVAPGASIVHRSEDQTPETVVDEVVIDDWFHLEQMNDRAYWMQIGDAWVWVEIPEKGAPIVTIRRGEYGTTTGETEV
jgi:hypothetical protein